MTTFFDFVAQHETLEELVWDATAPVREERIASFLGSVVHHKTLRALTIGSQVDLGKIVAALPSLRVAHLHVKLPSSERRFADLLTTGSLVEHETIETLKLSIQDYKPEAQADLGPHLWNLVLHNHKLREVFLEDYQCRCGYERRKAVPWEGEYSVQARLMTTLHERFRRREVLASARLEDFVEGLARIADDLVAIHFVMSMHHEYWIGLASSHRASKSNEK